MEKIKKLIKHSPKDYCLDLIYPDHWLEQTTEPSWIALIFNIGIKSLDAGIKMLI